MMGPTCLLPPACHPSLRLATPSPFLLSRYLSATESLDARSTGDPCRRRLVHGGLPPPTALSSPPARTSSTRTASSGRVPTLPPPSPISPPISPSPAAANPNPSPALARAVFRHLPKRNLEILAALPKDDKKPPTPKAKPAFPQRRATTTAVTSTSARMIPSIPKPEFALSMPGGKIRHHSAPVNVPMAPPKARRGSGKLEMNDDDLGRDEEMLPPHEIVARRSWNKSPMTTFSVLEGIGRTLKGRNLCQVRNPVWRKMGFLD